MVDGRSKPLFGWQILCAYMNHINGLTIHRNVYQCIIRDVCFTENASMRRNDKKKRSSSSALSCSDESHQNSDEENDRVLVNPLADASAILQQVLFSLIL